MCIFFHLIIQNEHLENSRCYVLRPAWVQKKQSTFSCLDRVLHLKAVGWGMDVNRTEGYMC